MFQIERSISWMENTRLKVKSSYSISGAKIHTIGGGAPNPTLNPHYSMFIRCQFDLLFREKKRMRLKIIDL